MPILGPAHQEQDSVESKDLSSATVMEDLDLFYYKQLAFSLQVSG